MREMVIVGKGRDAFGNRVVTYFYEDQPDLKRIILKKELKKEDKKHE